MSDLHEFIALWENTSKNGETYMTGRLGNARVVFFRNGHKDKDSQPDWRGYTTPPKNREQESNGNGNGGGGDDWDI